MTGTAWTAVYEPGRWIAVAGDRTWVLADCPPDHEVVHGMLGPVRAGEGADAVLTAVLDAGLRAVPSFAIVSVGTDELRILLRGEAQVHLSAPDELLSGGRPWTERVLPVARGHVVRLAAPADPPGPARPALRLPLWSGVALAGAVELTGSSAAPSLVPPPGKTAAAPAAAATEQKPAEAATDRAAVPEGSRQSQFAHLFGPTQQLKAVPAHRPREAPTPIREDTILPGDTMFPADTSYPEPIAPPGPSPAAAMSGDPRPPGPVLIDSVPWLRPEPDPTGPDQPDPIMPGVGPTGAAASLGALPAVDATVARSSLALPSRGPMVIAAPCGQGHLSPANGGTCRVCGGSVDPGGRREIPRPPLGRLVFDNGAHVQLDRPVVVGREPVEQLVPGLAGQPAERPHLIKMGADGSDLSRQHLRVSLVGWDVLVADLGSTNGTVLQNPDEPPVPLAPDTDTLLRPGAVLTLAEVVTCRFEVTA